MAKPVLYIDSDPGWMEQIVASFDMMGQPLLTATNAADALAKAEMEGLGLILLGLRVENESSLSLVRFLRANHPDVPILIFGGKGEADPEVKSLLQAGASGQVEKSGPDEFLVALGSYLSP